MKPQFAVEFLITIIFVLLASAQIGFGVYLLGSDTGWVQAFGVVLLFGASYLLYDMARYFLNVKGW